MRIVIGTRGSELALVQAEAVKAALEAKYAGQGLVCELCVINSAGDVNQETPLAEMGMAGVFTRRIEKALLGGDIDLAVHSYKDLPAVIAEGLVIAAVPVRQDAADVMVLRCIADDVADRGCSNGMGRKGCGSYADNGSDSGAGYIIGGGVEGRCVGSFAADDFAVNERGDKLRNLPQGAMVLTGSVRRKAQLLHVRGDLQVVGVRGNIHTRLRKLDRGDGDAVAMILAAAGLKRLGLQGRIAERFDVWDFIPSCGQGALALQCRVGDEDTIALVSGLNDDVSRVCVEAERSFLRVMGAGCSTPVGAYARVLGDEMVLKAMLASEDGEKMVAVQIRDAWQRYEDIGKRAADQVLQKWEM